MKATILTLAFASAFAAASPQSVGEKARVNSALGQRAKGVPHRDDARNPDFAR